MGCCPAHHKKEKPSDSKSRNITKENPPITVSMFRRKSSKLFSSEYERVKSLGSGAFSDVILAFHKQTQTLRAVKIIRKARLSTHQLDTLYILQEFKNLRELDHPHIVKCYELLQSSNIYYIATEYCPGGNLFSKLVKLNRLTEQQVSDIIHQLLSALAYCHEKGVIHRDLKPENILLLDTIEGLTVKICDFGSSVKFVSPDRISGCFGTAYYIAPEVLQSSYNEKCDIWSIGIIMYILLTGRSPYVGRSNFEIIQEIRLHPFKHKKKHMKEFSSLSVDLLKKLLKIDPKKRISAAEALKHDWVTKINQENLTNSDVPIEDLMKFHNNSMISTAVHLFIASQIYTDNDMETFIKWFKSVDKDGNGKIDKNELKIELSKKFEESEAEIIASNVIKEMDLDYNGLIDYTEFLTKCSEKLRTISLQNLEAAFNMFDVDKSGSISTEEIKFILQTEGFENNYFWEKFIQDADQNGDGVIDLKEFFDMMNNSLVKCASNYIRNLSRKNN